MLPTPAHADAPPRRVPLYRQLYVQVLAAITLGILLGHFLPSYGEQLKPLGDAFIKLVKMIIAPVIFLTVVTGIAGMRDIGKVGGVAAKAFAYFITVSSFVLVVGLVVANVLKRTAFGSRPRGLGTDDGQVMVWIEVDSPEGIVLGSEHPFPHGGEGDILLF